MWRGFIIQLENALMDKNIVKYYTSTKEKITEKLLFLQFIQKG